MDNFFRNKVLARKILIVWRFAASMKRSKSYPYLKPLLSSLEKRFPHSENIVPFFISKKIYDRNKVPFGKKQVPHSGNRVSHLGNGFPFRQTGNVPFFVFPTAWGKKWRFCQNGESHNMPLRWYKSLLKFRICPFNVSLFSIYIFYFNSIEINFNVHKLWTDKTIYFKLLPTLKYISFRCGAFL